MSYERHLLRPLSAARLLHHSDLDVAAGGAVVTAAMTLISAAVVAALVAQGAALQEKEEFPAALNPSLWK